MARVLESAGVFLGVAAGLFSLAWWKQSNEPKDSEEIDTGQKTPDGKPIIEVIGVGGEDDGKSVKGYILPDKISDLKLPVTVVVRPNKNLFLEFKIGEKITFKRKRNSELIWDGKIGEASGEYIIWYPNVKKAAVGAV